MTEQLNGLRRILNEAIDDIIAACAKRNEEFPSIDNPAQPSEFSPHGIRNDPTVSHAIKLGVAAAHQLVATLQSPMQTVIGIGTYTTLPGNVAVVERTHVAEIIRQYGKGGMCAADIVKYNGTSADKLERILRHLATHHVFREVSPGVFAHNMLSSLLDTGKDVELIMKNLDGKFDGTNGLAAYISSLTSEQIKTYASMWNLMTDDPRADSQELNETSFQRAYDTNLTFWQFLDLPENDFSRRRFDCAMQGVSSMQPPGTILTTYDWNSMPESGTIVDVGSGLGHVSLEIASVRPDLTFILEDRPSVLEDARKYWTQHAPELVENAHFIATDYLCPQPQLPTVPDILLLRFILHNLSDKYATILLKHLRAIAKSSTKLIVVDYVVEHACLTPRNLDSESQDTIPGAAAPAAPSPLLPNYGLAGALTYQMDMIMLAHFNAKERTIEHWIDLFSASGWRLVKVNRDPTNKTDWPLLVAEVVEGL
ncbi:S-adenosyl-L-methionine-dependent methyltransferase [Irpex rosettiformis]|uniref:S-adenosyl-L-methionine-dependent methyltransferase n=1 Tax=Irpex rosettiformis TaxID=378272 RepID=A0ACB8TUZ8_9APHY|nr:S-adenosyl-L-methionine-dependent methyltransferase [Irpex rosettiformis]